MKKPEIIIALDYPDKAQALALIDELDGVVDFFKIGMELGLRVDDEFISSLVKRGKKIFLDYKYHDIGNTVERAVKNAADLGVYMLTVHAEEQVLEAAVRGATGTKTKVFGVTVLTSLDDAYATQNYNMPINALVEKRAEWVRKYGANGVICSPLEIGNIKTKFPTLEICTPGIRPTGFDKGDQNRIATPAQAIKAGANYLVIGRPITQAQNPRQVAQDIIKEIQ
jgi:orotidine-5'-phosphate decarboxylase